MKKLILSLTTLTELDDHEMPILREEGTGVEMRGDETFEYELDVTSYVFDSAAAAEAAMHTVNQFIEWDNEWLGVTHTSEGLCIYHHLKYGGEVSLPVRVVDMRANPKEPLNVDPRMVRVITASPLQGHIQIMEL